MLSIQEHDAPEVSVTSNKDPFVFTSDLKQGFVRGAGETDSGCTNDIVPKTLQMPGRGCVHVLIEQKSHSGGRRA